MSAQTGWGVPAAAGCALQVIAASGWGCGRATRAACQLRRTCWRAERERACRPPPALALPPFPDDGATHRHGRAEFGKEEKTQVSSPHDGKGRQQRGERESGARTRGQNRKEGRAGRARRATRKKVHGQWGARARAAGCVCVGGGGGGLCNTRACTHAKGGGGRRGRCGGPRPAACAQSSPASEAAAAPWPHPANPTPSSASCKVSFALQRGAWPNSG